MKREKINKDGYCAHVFEKQSYIFQSEFIFESNVLLAAYLLPITTAKKQPTNYDKHI